jgi:elongation factor P
MFIMVDGHPYAVLEVVFASPTARSSSAMVRAKLRHLLTGAVQDKNFKTGEKFPEADVETVPVSFLYSDPDAYHFMDESTFEQFFFSREKIKDVLAFLKEGMNLQAVKFNGGYVSLQFPVYVELKVAYTEPARRSDSGSGSSTKKAKLETGIEVDVPLYIKEGDTIRLNTETGEVGGRV